MSGEKQIEDMVKDLCEIHCKGFKCEVCDMACEYRMLAEALYNIGYRKQSEKYLVKENGDIIPLSKQSEWISVEERLPEPNEECLVSARVGDRVVIDLGEIVQYWNGRTNEYGFMWMITNDWDEGEGCEITHWMPLPEPPKESKR